MFRKLNPQVICGSLLDTWHVYVSQDEKNITEQPDILATIEKLLNQSRNVFELFTYKAKQLPELHTGLYTDMWYEIDLDIVLESEEYKEHLLKMGENKKHKQEAELKRLQAFETAKKTGTKQFLSSWSEECNEPEESCDIDNVYLYAMPDGSMKEERNHTW